jgi:hypothetical protein
MGLTAAKPMAISKPERGPRGSLYLEGIIIIVAQGAKLVNFRRSAPL